MYSLYCNINQYNLIYKLGEKFKYIYIVNKFDFDMNYLAFFFLGANTNQQIKFFLTLFFCKHFNHIRENELKLLYL